jgi:hypothetical protein
MDKAPQKISARDGWPGGAIPDPAGRIIDMKALILDLVAPRISSLSRSDTTTNREHTFARNRQSTPTRS